jgi:hypothetical protein
MKKLSLLTLALGAVFNVLLAQPTLQNNVYPEVGDVITTTTAVTANNITEGSAGANQTWNFSGLQPDPQFSSTTFNFVAVGTTPYAADFPGANLAQVVVADTPVYAYYKVETNQLSILGSATQDFSLTYTNPQIALKTPLSFNGSFQDTYTGLLELTGQGITFQNAGNRTTTYDGYGTLQTPSGTFNNAIRLKTVSTEKDSVGFGPGTYSITETVLTSYDFYVPNRVGPQVTVSYTEGVSTTVIPGFPPIVEETPLTKNIDYVSSFVTAAPEPAAVLGMSIESVGPNPATDHLNVRFTETQANRPLQLLVTDMTGKVLQTIAVDGDASVVIPVGALAPATYFLTLTDGKAVQTLRWVKG